MVQKEIIDEHILRIQRKKGKPCIVGDLAYPLHTQIQKPYIANQIGSDDQKDYDESINRRRHEKIENTFGIFFNW